METNYGSKVIFLIFSAFKKLISTEAEKTEQKTDAALEWSPLPTLGRLGVTTHSSSDGVIHAGTLTIVWWEALRLDITPPAWGYAAPLHDVTADCHER